MKHTLIGLAALLSFSAFASSSDQEVANSLYRSFSSDILNAVSLENAAKNELPNKLLDEETSYRMSYCRTGDIGKMVAMTVPFNIGRKQSCIKGYRDIAKALEEVKKSASFQYLDEITSLASKAQVISDKLSKLDIEKGNNTCNGSRSYFIENMRNGKLLYTISVSDKYIKKEMTTSAAVEFVNSHDDLVEFIDAGADKAEKLSRGQTVHLALKVLRSSIANSIVGTEYLKLASRQLNNGCK